MKLKELIMQTRKGLEEAGVENPGLEARFLIEDLCGIKENGRTIFADSVVGDEAKRKVAEALHKRKEGYPLQYILGKWEFYGYPFYVGEGVLIPRPDTEIAVDCALNHISKIKKPSVADLCSGSGCIAISIARKRPESRVMALELYPNAYEYLEKNIGLHKTENVMPLKADVLSAISSSLADSFDVIVSNPPYIKSDDIICLSREVKFEPKTALDGSPDGLYYFREITKRWKPCLKDGGRLVFEIGYDQAEEVSAILQQNGLADIEVIKDYGGNTRVVTGVNKIEKFDISTLSE